MTWRSMQASDMKRVKEVSDICYAHSIEDEAALINKFTLYP